MSGIYHFHLLSIMHIPISSQSNSNHFYLQHNHSLISEPNIISTRVSSRFPTLNLIIILHFKFESHNLICLDIILIQSQLPLYWLYFNSIFLSQISVKFVYNSNSLSLGVFKQFTLFKKIIFFFEHVTEPLINIPLVKSLLYFFINIC